MSRSDISACKLSPTPPMQLDGLSHPPLPVPPRPRHRGQPGAGGRGPRRRAGADRQDGASADLASRSPCSRRFPISSRSSGCFARRSGPTSRRRNLSLWCMGSRGLAAATSASRRCRFARRSRSLSGISRRSRRGCRCSACLAQRATGSRPTRPVWTSTSMTTPSASSSAMPTQSATAPSRSRWGTRISSATSTGSIFCAGPSARTRRSWSTPTRRGAPRKPR